MTNDRFPYKEEDYVPEITAETLSDGSVVYVATYPELDGCMAHGDTEIEARENLSEAFRMTVEHLLKYELPIPPPHKSAVERFVIRSYLVPDRPVASELVTVKGSVQSVSVSASSAVIPSDWLARNLYFRPFSLSLTPNGVPLVLAEAS